MIELPDYSNFFDAKTLASTRENLRQAGMPFNERKWLSLALFASLFFSVFVLFSSYVFLGLSYALASLLAAFAFSFLALLKYPVLKKKKRAAEIESSLSIALRTASIELNSGASFEKVLKTLSIQEGELGKEFTKTFDEVRSGASVSRALSTASGRVDSLLFKNACMQLSFAYEHGLKTDSLRKLADELISLQKSRAKEFSGKQAFFSLLFIAVSCIVPALFAAYVIVGSSFMKLSFGPTQILFAFLLLFPLLDLTLLIYLREKTPRLLAS